MISSHNMLVSAILFLLLPVLQAQSAFALHTWGTTPNSTTTLLVNAIVGKENQSSVECWAVEPGYQLSAVTGNNVLQLGDLTNASFSLWPNSGGPIDLGFHNAPAIQWVVMLTGSSNITFPNATISNLTINPGELFVAADVAGTSTIGHRTVGDPGSTVLQIPFQDGIIVDHVVVNRSGPCSM